MFHFSGFPSAILPEIGIFRVFLKGFPHSEISGSKSARRLPEAYRSYATSFIGFSNQGIHHTLLNYIRPVYLVKKDKLILPARLTPGKAGLPALTA